LVQLLKMILTVLAGIALGLAATFFTIERGLGFGAVRAGPWTGWPKTGAKDADPYARAVLARTGELPLGTAEGLTFVAKGEGQARLFDPRCDYKVHDPVPQARFWTLTASKPDGRLIPNAAKRYGFTSAEIVRATDGSFEIAVSPEVQPGNWLPVASDEPFILVLRLFDTAMSASTTQLGRADMPRITRERCS
jgi:hypothetical protein